MLLSNGGDTGPGDAIELCPLALLELFLLLPCLNLARWKLIRLAAEGEKGLIPSAPGLESMLEVNGFAKPLPSLWT